MTALTRDDLEGLRQALLLGTTRRPIVLPPSLRSRFRSSPDAIESALISVALVGQHLRVRRAADPKAPETLAEPIPLYDDPRLILPDPVRRAIFRVLDWTHKDWLTSAALSASRRVTEAGFRPHPFDVPRLLAITGNHEDPAEEAFLSLSEAVTGTRGYTRSVGLTAENWTEKSSLLRRSFLRRQRCHDVVATRAFVEPAFRSGSAEIRADIIDAITICPGREDLPLLEVAIGDRAETVRTAAAAMLKLVPGTGEHAARLAAAVSCFKRVDRNVVSKVLILVRIEPASPFTFVPPRTSNRFNQTEAVRQIFEGISLPELSAALGASDDDVMNALDEDYAELFWTIRAKAIDDCHSPTLRALAAWRLMTCDRDLMQSMISRLVDPPVVLSREQATGILLRLPAWKEKIASLVSAGKDDGTLILMATMLPAPAMTDLLASLPSSSGATHAARAFAEFVVALETARRSVTQTLPHVSEGKAGE